MVQDGDALAPPPSEEPTLTDPATGEVLRDSETGRLIETPNAINQRGEWVRQQFTPQQIPRDGQVVTPDQVIRDLERAKSLVGRMPIILRDAEKTEKATKRLYELTKARAYKAASGTVKNREAEATEASQEAWEMWDNAQIALRFARNVGESLERATSLIQTQAKLVELTYHLAGRGER